MKNIHKIALFTLSYLLVGASALAGDAHHDKHAAPAAKDPHAAAPAKEAPAAAGDAHASPAAPESATAAKDEASAKPAVRKPKRKKAKAKEASAGKHNDAAHGDTHDTPVPPSIAPTTRVRVKDRASAAAAVAASQPSGDHGAHDAHAAPTAAAVPDAAHATDHHHAAQDAATTPASAPVATSADAHGAHAPAAPAPIAPTRRARVKASLPAKPAPSAGAADSAHTAHAADTAHSAAPAAATIAHDVPAAHDDHATHAGHDMHDGHKQHGEPATATTHASPAATLKPEHAHGADSTAAANEPLASASECSPPLKAEIANLFDRWNASLRSGDPKKVVANYAPDSILLPTVSNRARFTIAEKEDYFMHFLQRRPQGSIDDRLIEVDCNSATDAGLYTFRFSDGSSVKARYSFAYKKINGQWLITSHHSSGMPEKPAAPVAQAEPHPPAKPADTGVQNKGWVRFP
jgi:uncharacterized protein (TIGR02246 family)